MGIANFGENVTVDFPTSSFSHAHVWWLAWSFVVEPLNPFVGTDQDWLKLVAIIVEATGTQFVEGTRIILPLAEGNPLVNPVARASGKTEIHASSALIQIVNNVGQDVTIQWEAWAKAW